MNIYPSPICSVPSSRLHADQNQAFAPGLPTEFSRAMKTLFDMLDDTGCGFVPLSEIERRWRDDAVPTLPGVLNYLRAVVPPNGMLSFDVFLHGARSALARAKQSNSRNKPLPTNNLINGASCGYSETSISPSYFDRPITAEINGQSSTSNHGTYQEEHRHVIQQRSWAQRNDTRFGNHQASNSQYFQPQPTYERDFYSSGHDYGRRQMPPAHWNGARVKITKMGYATKFSAQDLKAEVSDKESSDLSKTSDQCSLEELKSNSSSSDIQGFLYKPEVKKQSDKPARKIPEHPQAVSNHISKGLSPSHRTSTDSSPVFASQQQSRRIKDLYHESINSHHLKNQDHAKSNIKGSASMEEGYIDISKAAAMITSQYGSLRRPAMSVPSKEHSCLEFKTGSRMSSHGERRRGKSSSRHHGRYDDARRRQYASAGESGDESHTRILPLPKRSSSCERKRTASSNSSDRTAPQPTNNRSNNSSPPERPASKSARNSSSPDTPDLNKEEMSSERCGAGEEENGEPRQLLVPPPSGRNLHCRSSTFCNTQDTSSSNIAYPHYATIGKRKQASNKRRDARRHTVADGIDFDLLKSVKLLEQETDLLLRGMEILDRGREWFQSGLSSVRERQTILRNLEANGEKAISKDGSIPTGKQLDSLSVRINEMETFVNTMTNLKLEDTDHVTNNEPSASPTPAKSLREQNHLLSTKLSQQAERIAQLEREKLSLVQQVFQSKSEAGTNENTSILI